MRLDQPGRSEHIQMERKSWPWKAQLARDPPRGEAERRVADEKPEDVQARLLGERGERIHSLRCIHISRTMEIYFGGQRLSSAARAGAARKERSRSLTPAKNAGFGMTGVQEGSE
jgi:hypothetical protein